MGFIRNSVTYNMIFYLQGPKEKDPLDAGIALIPYGLGMICIYMCVYSICIYMVYIHMYTCVCYMCRTV